MKNLILLVLIIFAFNSLEAQKRYLEPNKNYSKAKIIQNGEIPIQAKNLIMVNDSMVQYSVYSKEGAVETQVKLSSSTIQKVLIKKGTYAAEYGLVFGLGALAGGLLGVAQAKNDPLYVDDGQHIIFRIRLQHIPSNSHQALIKTIVG